jgi:hypothetical protein
MDRGKDADPNGITTVRARKRKPGQRISKTVDIKRPKVARDDARKRTQRRQEMVYRPLSILQFDKGLRARHGTRKLRHSA